MSLYDHRAANIRKTWLLFVMFFTIVIAIGWGFSLAYNSPAILFFAVIFSLVMNISSYWQSDKLVIKLSGAVRVGKKEYPELYNIVENLSITAGLPMPKLYVINDNAPNAFATGRDPEHSAVVVTIGLMEVLNRSEIEGVIAHELSHIGNRDILISTVAVVLVGFIAILTDMFMRSLFWGGGRNRNGGGAIILFGIALAMLSPFIALIPFAISRKREYLADASGALLTRYPDALANALVKISKNPVQLKSANNATNHLWVSDPVKGKKGKHFMAKLFMTHPPVEERIAKLRQIKI